MRNFAQQKRVFDAVIYTFFMWLLFVLLFITLYLNMLFPKAKYFGFADLPYTESAPAGKVQKGDLIFYDNSVPREGSVFTYILPVRDTSGYTHKEVQTKIYLRTEYAEEMRGEGDEAAMTTVAYYVVQTPGLQDESFIEVANTELIGFYLFRIPYVGYAAMYLNYNLIISICTLLAIWVLLLIPAYMLTIKRMRLANIMPWYFRIYRKHKWQDPADAPWYNWMGLPPFFRYINRALLFGFIIPDPILIIVGIFYLRKHPLSSPFREGVDLSKLSEEQYYIYNELKHFFTKADMSFEKDYDCYKIYIKPGSYSKKILFGTLILKHRYLESYFEFLVNRDFKRSDGRVDRSAFIPIRNATELPAFKERVHSIYRSHFKSFVDSQRQY